MSRLRLMVLGTLALPLLSFGVVAAVWAAQKPEPGEVAPNVTIDGVEVSGADRDRLTEVLGERSSLVEATTVTIRNDDFELETTAGDLGLSVDEEATITAALAVGRRDPGPTAPIRHALRWFTAEAVPLRLTVDGTKASRTLEAIETEYRVDVVEPSIDTTGDSLSVVAGVPGRAIAVEEVLAGLPRSLARSGEPIDIEAAQTVTPPRIADAEVARLVDQANQSTAEPISITIGERTVEVPGTLFRPGFSLAIDGGGPHLVVDTNLVSTVLAAQQGVSVANPTGVRFDIVGGIPTPVGGADAQACCGEQAPKQLADALLAGKTTVTLDTRTVTVAEGIEWANTLGVKEVVGEFTTRHPCCAPRVKNIHRISDLTRGVLIAPGETFSVNQFVGRRTAEKGFVSAPVIEQGEFREDIGGGVSQYATTLFNAAFFGGLDIPEHKAHSIYISRYPFGREATLAYPSVDLKIRNDTPYGVVIWPTYTNSSITVQLWSTRHAVGAQTAINKSGGCGAVNLTRTRLFVADGRSETDTFSANYDCDPPEH